MEEALGEELERRPGIGARLGRVHDAAELDWLRPDTQTPRPSRRSTVLSTKWLPIPVEIAF